MAKATSSRKPARVKRKAQTAAKRAAPKSGAARARRAGGARSGSGAKAAASPRTSVRVRPATALRASRGAETRDKDPGSREQQQPKDLQKHVIVSVDGAGRAPRATASVVVKAAPPPVETVRVPPPLPVPIASFTF